ncbi:MAG: hypothetical protein M5U01_41275 [Ardenticatenaceae bacterium]|nr:hypothetical protein [Ardenticatenaceae bacterium]
MNQLNEQQLHQHVTLLGWLDVIGSAVFLVIGVFVMALLGGIGAATGDPVAARILGIVGSTVGALLVVLALPGIIAGFGLLQRKAWARFLALVVGFLNLINFPLGTAIGIYTFWVLMQESATGYFEAPAPRGGQRHAPV